GDNKTVIKKPMTNVIITTYKFNIYFAPFIASPVYINGSMTCSNCIPREPLNNMTASFFIHFDKFCTSCSLDVKCLHTTCEYRSFTFCAITLACSPYVKTKANESSIQCATFS